MTDLGADRLESILDRSREGVQQSFNSLEKTITGLKENKDFKGKEKDLEKLIGNTLAALSLEQAQRILIAQFKEVVEKTDEDISNLRMQWRKAKDQEKIIKGIELNGKVESAKVDVYKIRAIHNEIADGFSKAKLALKNKATSDAGNRITEAKKQINNTTTNMLNRRIKNARALTVLNSAVAAKISTLAGALHSKPSINLGSNNKQGIDEFLTDLNSDAKDPTNFTSVKDKLKEFSDVLKAEPLIKKSI